MLEAPARGSFTDLGCGSGVLSIAAAKLGFDPVLGVDADRAAVEETDRNARANYVQVDVRRLDLRSEPVPVADVMAANLTTRLCEAVAQGWAARGERPGSADRLRLPARGGGSHRGRAAPARPGRAPPRRFRRLGRDPCRVAAILRP